jgi:hypothetical protein
VNDPIPHPPRETVTHFGVTVPILEHMLVGEYDELEALLANPDITGFHKDVESFAICARYRSDAVITFDAVRSQPMDREAFTRDVRRLLDPFVRAQRALAKQRREERLAMLTDENIQAEIEALTRVRSALQREPESSPS